VKCETPRVAPLPFQGEHSWVPRSLISPLRANKILRRGYQVYLALVKDIQGGEGKLENVPVM